MLEFYNTVAVNKCWKINGKLTTEIFIFDYVIIRTFKQL